MNYTIRESGISKHPLVLGGRHQGCRADISMIAGIENHRLAGVSSLHRILSATVANRNESLESLESLESRALKYEVLASPFSPITTVNKPVTAATVHC